MGLVLEARQEDSIQDVQSLSTWSKEPIRTKMERRHSLELNYLKRSRMNATRT